MIYTTYFNNLQELPDNIIPISISGKAPDWYAGKQYKKLAPKYNFFQEWKRNGDNNYYIREFDSQVLSKLDPHQVVSELLSGIPSGCTVALVCYESPNKFCHRHLVANWLISAGYQVEEYS